MKYALLLVGLLALMALSANADHPGGCFDRETGKVLMPGEVTTGLYCSGITCTSNGGLKGESCGVVGVEPPCWFGATKYPDAPYPKCCEKILHCLNN